MNESNSLIASMLGSCKLSYQGKTLDSKNVHSKRIWTLLAYLITNRHRAVTQNELIELLYPDDKSESPLSALKTLVHRARSALNKLGFADGKLMLQQALGGYQWNLNLPLELDVEVFEKLSEASKLEGNRDAQLQSRLRAIDLYKGDFLADFGEETWTIPITSYYRYLYMDTVLLALEELMEQNRFSDVINVSQKAIGIDPYEERLYYQLVSALISTNQIPAAKTQYEKMTKLFYSEFGVTPSKELQSLYKKLTNANNGIEKDLSIIKTQMQDDGEKRGAFYCEYEFFKDIYKLVLRTVARDEKPIHICLLSIHQREESRLPPKTQEMVMNRLSDCIQLSLRKGDIYSRYSISQYIILLPLATYENSEMVLARIIGRFWQENPYLSVQTTYSIEAIDTKTEPKILSKYC